MREQKLTRVFDQVKLSPEREQAILADLLTDKTDVTDKKEVPVMKNRRLTAVLEAALMVIVLVGAVLAAGYFGRVELKPEENQDSIIDSIPGGRAESEPEENQDGDNDVPGSSSSITIADLSEEFWTKCAEKELYRWEGSTWGRIDLPFKEWSEAEECMGVELLDNAVLDELKVHYSTLGYGPYEKPKASAWSPKNTTYCLANVYIDDKDQPYRIDLSAAYNKSNCWIHQTAQIATDAYSKADIRLDETDVLQEYTTPNGLEVSICLGSEVSTYEGDDDYYIAYFVKNGVFFTLQLQSRTYEAWSLSQSIVSDNTQFCDPWDTLIEILDAYMADGPSDRIPVSELSEEFLKKCAEAEPKPNEYWGLELPFKSWTEAEKYLGIELADNEVLEQCHKPKWYEYNSTSLSGHQEKRKTNCLMSVSVSDDHLPKRIGITSGFTKDGFSILLNTWFLTDAADEWDNLGFGFQGEFQEYTTPRGLEAVIYSETRTQIGTYDKSDYKVCRAYFMKNGVVFYVDVSIVKDSGEELEDPWDTLIEILDAYE